MPWENQAERKILMWDVPDEYVDYYNKQTNNDKQVRLKKKKKKSTSDHCTFASLCEESLTKGIVQTSL